MATGPTALLFHLRSLGAVAALFASAASFAGAAATPTPEQGVERVQAAKLAAYREVLSEYDAAIKNTPEGVALAVARCRYIGSFLDEESGEWIDSAPDEFDECQQVLEERFQLAPEVQAFKVENLWGAEAVKEGEKLFAHSEQWPVPLRRTLLAKLSQSHEMQKNTGRAGELAVMAVGLGEHSLAPEAIKHLAEKRNVAAAIKLLRETPAAMDAWDAGRRVEAALEIPERKWARWELSRYTRSTFKVRADVAARAHLHAGDAVAARALLKGDDAVGSMSDPVRFDVLLAAGDLQAAAELVDLTDLDNLGEYGRRFATLLTHSPAALLSGPMLKAALICLIGLGALALLPGLLLVPAHYRSLIRKSRGQPIRLPIFESVGLRHAWVGMALMLLVPMVVGALVEPGTVGTLIDGQIPQEPARFFRAMLWGTVAGLFGVALVARKMPMRELAGDRNALREAWWVVGIWVGLVVIGALATMAGSHNGQNQGGSALSEHGQMMNALAIGGREAVGPFIALLLPALLVPIFEELSFRGLFLGGLSRHLSFGWANTIQAAVFAAIHDDPVRLPFYFAMGLTAGWLVKRTRSLGPAIALHALNNAVAFSLKLF